MRYIFDKKGLNLLNLQSEPAMELLASDKVITNEVMHFISADSATAVLTDSQVKKLRDAGLSCEPEKLFKGTLAETSYVKRRSGWIEYKRRGESVDVNGDSVAIIGTGSNHTAHFFAGFNFASASTDVTDTYIHDTYVHSIINHPLIGLVTNAQVHILKVTNAGGFFIESALIAAYDYCLSNNIRHINNSFSIGGFALAEVYPTIIANLKTNNCINYAASGNSTFVAGMASPAILPDVMAVTQISNDGTLRYKSWVPIIGNKGVDFLGGGFNQEVVLSDGVTVVTNINGTSLSCPTILALAMIKKAELKKIDPVKYNNGFVVAQYLKNKGTPVSLQLQDGSSYLAYEINL